MQKMMVWLFILLCCCASAAAEVGLAYQLPLEQSELMAPIRQTEYAACPLYQPEQQEIDAPLPQQDIDRLPYFPVVAVQEDQPVLILLRRESDAWVIDTVSKTALRRDGYVLESIRADAYPEDGTLYMYFDFRQADEEYYDHTLTIVAQEPYGVRVDRFSIRADEPPAGMLYANVVDIAFNRGYRFSYWYSETNARLEYGIELYEDASTGELALFDLAEIPLTIFDTMTECTVSDTTLYQFPSEASAPLLQLAEGETILREQCSFGFAVRDWVLAASGGVLGYIRTADIPELTVKE